MKVRFNAFELLFTACLISLAGCGGGSSSPTPAAPQSTQTPAPTPTLAPGALAASPSTLSLISTTNAVPITVSEPGYSGAFSVSGCSSNASITPQSASGPQATFNATGTTAGTCTLTISDSNGQQASIAVTVTTTSGVVQ